MNHSVSARWLALLPLLALAGLAGCADPDADHPATYCPNVAVLQQAQVVNDYQPGRSDPAAQITSATVTGVAGTCTATEKFTKLNVRFQAGFSAVNGPANGGKPLTLPYFVSISQGSNIISKTMYSVTFNFSGNYANATALSKTITIDLANLPASAHTDILVGWQLTPQQLATAIAVQ